jgi:FkbM family methyltransferase
MPQATNIFRMDQLAIRMLRAARQSAYHCGLEPLFRRSHRLTSLYHAAYDQVKPLGLTEIALPGYTLAISASDSSIAYNLLTRGSYEPYESSLFLDAVAGGHDVIDVGAHVGYYALMAATAIRQTGRVWAFEPHPANFALLQDNVARNKLANVSAMNAAASGDPGRANLFVAHDGNTGGHSLAAKPGQSTSIEVPLVRVDDVVPSGTRVSVVKIDAEGWEVDVLRGMRRVLTGNHPLLFTEFFPDAIARAGHDPREFLAELEAHGYGTAVIDSVHEKVVQMGAEQIMAACPTGALNLLCSRSDA